MTQPIGTSPSAAAFFACRMASFIYFSSGVSFLMIFLLFGSARLFFSGQSVCCRSACALSSF
jgi:hypothetical protein